MYMHSQSGGALMLRGCKCGLGRADSDHVACSQIADFGLSRVLEDDMTHVFTNNHGAHGLPPRPSLGINGPHSCQQILVTEPR